MKHFINITTLCLLWSALCYGQLVPTNLVESANNSCPDLAIQLKAPKGNNTFYAISYCNAGGAMAENSYLEIYLDSDLSITQSTHPLQYKSGNTYRFLIGTVAAGECGSMYFQIPKALIEAHCLAAFAATALPCTSQAISLQTIRTSEDDNDGTTNNDDDDNGITIMQAELDLTPTGASSYSDPIFEDHVFLDFVPTWDSLMRMFNGLQSYSFDPSDSGTTVNSTLVIVPLDEDLPVYATAYYCRQQAATTNAALSTNDGAVLSTTVLDTNEEIEGKNLSILEEQQILLFPNPVQQQATLEVYGYENETLQVEVFSATGQRVAYLESASNHLFIQVDTWNKGVYFYRLYADGQAIDTGRFIVE